jgi:hypothetical protein
MTVIEEPPQQQLYAEITPLQGSPPRLSRTPPRSRAAVHVLVDIEIASRFFAHSIWAERRPALAQAVMAPLICCSSAGRCCSGIFCKHPVRTAEGL